MKPQSMCVPPSEGSTVLSVESVSLVYKTQDALVTAVSEVSFRVDRGDRLVLLGTSGCGKSSLLKAIGGFLPPTRGEIKLHGRRVHGPGPDRMMVFQEFDQLLPWKSVTENIAFPLEMSGRTDAAEARRRALRFVDKVGLTRFADAYPHTLSGGMKQRVAIARAMAMQPEILLMDEPFASLDALTRRQMQSELLELWQDTDITLVFVTHSVEEALIIGTRLLLLSSQPGRVLDDVSAGGAPLSALAPDEHRRLLAHIDRRLLGAMKRDEAAA
ncbi:ABC transporter ATP-binding protein [Rhodopseudomonas palustris]|uniref:ABC transporter ATP-binding protein n=1 Tax=Rhodopseudomonas palustris TaxID=1076 RepID=UPI000E5A83A8|nr:ABC transporter ATP-binding protein [Rhodopseudomonas palustris]QLH73830.1 ABC transporter ATP-binding protein [Rhodopseudomonas palustris]RIA03845.1 ABC transporter ATP-binding protein [Rhodopseudomonas palustris]